MSSFRLSNGSDLSRKFLVCELLLVMDTRADRPWGRVDPEWPIVDTEISGDGDFDLPAASVMNLRGKLCKQWLDHTVGDAVTQSS
jgi:hypothetical protein